MNRKPTSLLVVDDDPVFTLFVRQLVLSLAGELPCHVTCADSGEAGLAEIRRDRFDLALVDYHLPGISGLDLLVAAGGLPLDQQPAVIMLTGSGNEAVAVEAMKRGAKDYLQKSALDMPSLMRALQSALAQKRLAEQVAAYNAQIKADLEMAHKLQESLLPQSYPVFPSDAAPGTSALRFEHRYFWTTQLGGDFFSVQNLSDTAAGVLICDVMGHGVRSALVTAMLRALVGDLGMHVHDPGRFLLEMNRRLAAILKQTGEPLYATAIYLVADIAAGELRYARAGHPAPLHLQPGADKVEALPFPSHAGAALGLFEKTEFATCRRPLAAGDRMLLFTDGLYEMSDDAGEEFGTERLLAATRRRLQLPMGELMDGLIADVRAHAGENEFEDDVCLLGMEVARTVGRG
jgi:sigma-B regulation protein RsbU (phosphoserine phosphatase)